MSLFYFYYDLFYFILYDFIFIEWLKLVLIFYSAMLYMHLDNSASNKSLLACVLILKAMHSKWDTMEATWIAWLSVRAVRICPCSSLKKPEERGTLRNQRDYLRSACKLVNREWVFTLCSMPIEYIHDLLTYYNKQTNIGRTKT